MPVYQNHLLTAEAVTALAATVDTSSPFELVIVDNGSPSPYKASDYPTPFPVRVIRNERNEGNFWPLRQVADASTDDIVATMHNDLLIYQPGWNVRLEAAFAADPMLGLVGFAGDDEIGADGQRVSTMSNLRGTRGHASAEAIGTRITGLRPAAAVDGLFMAFRRRVLEVVTLERTMPPAHYFDFIWSAQALRAGWRVATLGIEADHVGWSTEGRLSAELDAEWRGWCADVGLDPGDDPMAVIRERGARDWRWLRGRYWPCRVGSDWVRRPTGLVAGVSMFHNEADVAGLVVRHMLEECDLVVVADNNSDDGSREQLEAIGDPRLVIVDEPSTAFNQAATMRRVAEIARERGALWAVPFDFDEWWDSPEGRLADVLRALPEEFDAVAAMTCDMIPQPSDDPDLDVFHRVTMTRPGSLWSQGNARKVAYITGPDRIPLQGNHGLVDRMPWDVEPGPIRIRHYPFRSREQASRKVRHGRRAILEAKLPTSSGTHWQEWGALSDPEFDAWWATWTDPAGLVPWAGDPVRVIIAAAGSSDRWGDYLGKPKQLAEVDGEPLLYRTLRLLRKHRIRDIVVTGDWSLGVPSVVPTGDTDAVDGRLAMRELWNPTGRTVVLMGDVFYSEEAIALILAHEDRDAHLFARFGPSSFTTKRWAEIFANSFWPEHHAGHEETLRTVAAMLRHGALKRAGLWEAYLFEHGHLKDGIDGTRGRVGNFGDATEIDDWTEDFDWPEDYDRFMRQYEARA
ncbi:MAG TPA: glycosyltransferase [Acidimicrobiia bacterium]|nr:glycosyltransferase [Acidimicrobiia bacterium]